MALIRLVVVGFVVLSIIYIAVSIYSRSLRREKLENSWAEENPGSDDEAARDTYIKDGMDAYQRGIRPKLLLLIYVVPAVLVAIALVVTNSN